MSSHSSPSTSSTTSPPNASQLAPRFPSSALSVANANPAVLAAKLAASCYSSQASNPTVSPSVFSAAAAAAAASMMSVPSPIFPPPPLSNGGHNQRLSPGLSGQQTSSEGGSTFPNATDFLEALARTAGSGMGSWRGGQQTSKPSDRLGFPSTEALLECCRAQ